MSGQRTSTQALAEDVLSRVAPGVIPPDVALCAIDRVTEALTISFNALAHPASVAARSIARPLAASEGCTILGVAGAYTAADASLANGTTAHCSLQEDLGPGGHPGTFVIPAALAAAELSQAPGSRFIQSVVAGYEVVGRVARATPDGMRERGFRSLPTLGVFGAAAAAAVGMGLDADGVAAALGLAANQAGGLYEGFRHGSPEGFLHAGFAARAGVTSAQLAAARLRPAASTLEGPYGFFATFAGEPARSSPLVPEFDPVRYEIELVRSKAFPACAQNQSSMIAISRDRRVPLEESAIDRVVLARPSTGPNGIHPPGVDAAPPYKTALQAQMSAIFTTCAALLGRSVAELSFFMDGFDDPEVIALCKRTELHTHDDEQARIDVRMRDGDIVVFETSPDAPPWHHEPAQERFVRLVARHRGDEAARRAAAALLQLNSLSYVSELTQLLRPV